MNIGLWSVRNKITVIVILVMIIFSGVDTYRSISRLEDPEFPIRKASITTIFPGASPKKVEQLVTDKLEKKIRGMGELKEIRSQHLTHVAKIRGKR